MVAFPPVGEATWSGIGPVGILRYRDAGVAKFVIAVRVVSPFPAAGEPFLPGVPFPASSEPPPRSGFAPLVGRELVPFKRECDVGFLGTLTLAAAPGTAAPAGDGVASVAFDLHIDDTRRVLSVPFTGGKVDLREARATVLGGRTVEEVRLGPSALEPLGDFLHFEVTADADAERFHSAGAALRFPYPKVGSRIAVASGSFALDAALGFEVFVRVDYLDGTVSLPVAVCDALTFDLDRRQVEWVFRAVAVDPAEGREIERVVVAAFAPGQDEERSRVDAWLPHASFVHAAGPEHVRAGIHPGPLGADELAMARYSTWDTGHFASTLPIEEVAQIQVELLQGRSRSAVLEAHGLDDYHYCLEERAAMDRLAEAGVSAIDEEASGEGGRGSPEGRADLDRYREAHARALAETPFEGQVWSVADYAELRAALEVRNPVRVLEDAGLGAAELVGLDFAMAARFEANAAERREYHELFGQALARFEAAAETNDDFAPPEDEDEDGDEDGDEKDPGDEPVAAGDVTGVER